MKTIGALLQEEELCSEEILAQALEQQQELFAKGIYKPIGQLLVEEGHLSPEDREHVLLKLSIERLSSLEIFQNLSRPSVRLIAEVVEHRVVPPNTLFIREGEVGDSFCIIVSGRVNVFRALEDGAKVCLNTLGPGECFGEMALLTGKPRSASIETTEPTSLLIIPKDEFDSLLKTHPTLNAHFLKVLSEWLNKSNVGLVAASQNEQAYQRFVSDQAEVPSEELIGSSKAVSKLRQRIKKVASRNKSILISGEPGTEKLAVAALLHRESGRGGSPFLTMNAKTVSLQDAGTSDVSHDALHLEVAQKSALFGHEKGDFSFAQARRLGLLEVGNAGSVVIEEVGSLTVSTQEDLADFLDSGEFRIVNGQRKVRSSALIIATDARDLSVLKEEGRLHPRLWEHLADNDIAVPPLRKRKRDVPLIVASLIERFNRQGGKAIRGMEREAHARIMAYNWPGNMEELEVVIRRAVNLAQGNELESEDVFIGIRPITGKLSFNLFRLDQVRRIFYHRAYPAALQLITGLFFALIIYEGFFGSQQAAGNVSLPLTWGIWEPTIIMSAFFAAKIWCAACPIGALSEVASRHFSLKRRVPAFIRHYGFWLGAIGIGAIMWAEVAFHLPFSPLGTAMLISTIAVLGFAFGVLFQRRSWCRYVCPLGYLIGVFSQCSLIEMRSNYGICNNQCLDHRCFVDTKDEPGCPMFQAPFSLASNLECILCAKCIKACPHESPMLNLRLPGYELSKVSQPSPVMNAFVPVILGSQLLRSLEAHSGLWLLQSVKYQSMGLALLLVVLSVGAYFFVRVSGSLSFASLQSTDAAKGELFNYALIPLIFAYELGYQLEAMLTRSGSLLPAIGHKIGLDWSHLAFGLSRGEILFWQTLLITAGFVFACTVLNNLIHYHGPGEASRRWLRRMPLFILAGSYLWSCFA